MSSNPPSPSRAFTDDQPSDHVTHSDPIPINNLSNHHIRPSSPSESSDSDSLPPLSPSQSPASTSSAKIQTPPNSRVPLSPISTSSPILAYFATKTPFSRTSPSAAVFEGQDRASCPAADSEAESHSDEESREPPPTPASPHGRRLSTSWIPVRFGPQQQILPPTESQQERGAGLLRRLSLSSSVINKPPVSLQPRSATPPNPNGGTPGPGKRAHFAQHRKAATLSAGTVDAGNKPRAPSPMGERMLKGHYDGF